MSGNVVIWDVSSVNANRLRDIFYFPGWSDLAHGAVGWNPASRVVLNNVRVYQVGIGNRGGLPPHKYFGMQNLTKSQLTSLYGHHFEWIKESLVRPMVGGFMS